MSSALLCILVALVCAIGFACTSQNPSIRRAGKALPRPPHTLPLVGNAFWFLQPRHVLLDWFVRCERRFGLESFEISVPTLPPGVVISDARNLEYVLKHDDIFTKGEFFKKRSWDLFGNGIINVDGPQWKLQRKAALPFFSSTNLKNLIEDVLPSYVADTRSELHDFARNGKTADLQHVFLKLTTRLMGNLAYDMDMDASAPFSDAFDFASGAIGERFQNPFWKLKELIFGSQLRAAILEVKAFGKRIVNTATESQGERSQRDPATPNSATISSNTEPEHGKLIDSLMSALGNPDAAADAALNFLSAGKDTTAQALTWTFYLLMRHPDAVRLIRDELRELQIQQRVPPDEAPSLGFDQLQPSSVPYLSAVFHESLRLYPPVPIEIKQCERATTLPDGTFLPDSAIVVWCTWAINRSRCIWGDDAMLFQPDRWLEDDTPNPEADDNAGMGKRKRKQKLKSKTAFEFPVFNGGPRTCMGKRMAELQAAYVIATLVWEFNFEEADTCAEGHQRLERLSRNSLTLPMEGGLPCDIALEKHDT
ncbi:MAG: hypothetical protein M1837_005946 [Sclerophora amabilis]|nr:MAG: hypothetical protein M1837_005946 [Sclerophora amabilis]